MRSVPGNRRRLGQDARFAAELVSLHHGRLRREVRRRTLRLFPGRHVEKRRSIGDGHQRLARFLTRQRGPQGGHAGTAEPLRQNGIDFASCPRATGDRARYTPDRRPLTFESSSPSKEETRPFIRLQCRLGARIARRTRNPSCNHGISVTPVETRHNQPSAFTMQQGPIPTQLCCGTHTWRRTPDQDEGIA